MILIFRKDAQHVAVKVTDSLTVAVWKVTDSLTVAVRFGGFHSWNCEAEPNHALSIECAEDLSAHLGGHHKQADRQQFDFFKTPDFLLQTDGRLQIRMR